MVGIDDDGGIFKPAFRVQIAKFDKVFVMVIRDCLSVFIHRTAQNRVRERISRAVHFPPRIHERVRMLRRAYRIHHNGQIAACRVFHADGNIEPACREPVELVFDRPCADRNVRQHVGQIQMVFGIKHFVRAGKSRFIKCLYVQFSYGDQPFQHIFVGVGIGLVQHSLVTVAGRARFVGINARHDDDFVGDLFLHAPEP